MRNSEIYSLSRKARGLRGALLSLAAVAGLALSGAPAASGQAVPGRTSAGNGNVPPAQLPASQFSYASVVSRVAPAVVTVRSERRVARNSQELPFLDDPALREFFGERLPRGGQQQPRTERRSGLGSGVIVSQDGYILTNHHVVEDSADIRVELIDNRVLKARLVGSDEPSDLAVLKVETTGLPVLSLGDSDRVQVGDVVLAVGNPLGIGQTVTSGIISAKGRQTGLSDGSFEDFLQTDASINRGNSGGALVNTSGELIGINSQILSPSGVSIGIGFAIPSNMARDVMQQLIRTGKVRRGMIGVRIQGVDAEIAEALGLKSVRGALVSDVTADSPASRAGLRRGDVILSLNGSAVADSNAFRNMVARTQPGTQVTLTVLRGGREQQLQATLAELPTETARTGSEGGEQDPAPNDTGRLGATVEPLTPESAARLELPRDARGLLITRVNPEGAAADAGLRRGDVIQEINQQPVTTPEQLRTALANVGDRPALLLVLRGGGSSYVPLRMRKQ